jgi:hypothetical protein
MTITSKQWSDALDPLIIKFFEMGMSRRTPLAPSLFNVQNSSESEERVGSIGAVSIDGWDMYEQTGVVASADFDQGYKKTYEHKEYPLEIPIKRKIFSDSRHREIFRIVDRIADSAVVLRETHGASVFNNAFDDNFPGADEVGLCSTAHPLSPNKTGTTQTNEGTLSMTAANIETTRIAMMAFTDDNNEKMGVTPNMLLVPPDLEDTAIKETRSVLDPASANNTANPQAGRWMVQPWHYLTDSNAWFMIDTTLMSFSLDWFNREPISIVPKVEDKTIQATWIAYMRYSFGFSDWRWIYGQNPS